MSVEPTRDPDALLRQIEAAERAEKRGQLKIFLGYASGVGKSLSCSTRVAGGASAAKT